jgi:alcohol dehydrogenase (cytochrome c)
MACPTPVGALRWQPPAYNPDRHIAFAGGADGCEGIKVEPQTPVGADGGNPMGVGKSWLGGTGRFLSPYGMLTAIDVTTGQPVAKRKLPFQNKSGVLATAGGLVFTGELDGTVTAYNDETLEPLWGFNTAISFKAPVISYAVGGKQYIAVIAGGEASPDEYQELDRMQKGAMVYVFAL